MQFQRVNIHTQPHIVPDLVALEQKCFSTPWGEEQYAAAFKQDSFVAYALYDQSCPGEEHEGQKGTLMGYISLYHALDEMEILNIAVDPLYRRQGLGGYLLGKALHERKELGAHTAVLEVREGNEPARKLYEKLGFSQVGKRKKYYADTGEDACVYTLALEGFCVLAS